jgi:hypothetical protein
LPVSRSSSFRGSRVEASRAGMMIWLRQPPDGSDFLLVVIKVDPSYI